MAKDEAGVLVDEGLAHWGQGGVGYEEGSRFSGGSVDWEGEFKALEPARGIC